jgi:glycosyltransferase involved in cell wall biosynthesis
VLCCSQFQREHLVALNPQIKRSEVISLWTDVDFWRAASRERQFAAAGQPLRVLCAGAISLRKGIPYLLQAVEPLASEVSLTLVGSISPEMRAVLRRFRSHRQLPYLPKSRLRDLYYEHDVLVMPTLGDSFGFVMLEAMASGIPVLASRNAGAPLPDDRWRVPAHDSDAIRERLLVYYADRALLRYDGETGRKFSREFAPEAYRAGARILFGELLAA